MNNHDSALTSEEEIYKKLVDSALYQTYKNAFHDATGMSLLLVPADEESRSVGETTEYTNRFCEAINGDGAPCQSCFLARPCLRDSASETAQTVTCFARMRETAIPIRGANQTVAFLCTGQIFAQPPGKSDFAKVAEHLRKAGFGKDKMKVLRKAWKESRVVSGEQYQGIVTILAAFALQLSEMLNRLMIEERNTEPEMIKRAKQYVCANLEEKVNLEDVAKRAGVSTFYFCKIFKSATGITLTEYVNRRRVEWAKRKLLNPHARVTEVAFDVGYQSLSQFNRSFLKYVGLSPTKYREEQTSEKVSITAIAA